MGVGTSTFRVAVVGAGPSGLYAADALAAREEAPRFEVDIIDRLPVPFGLVRYGVAPDHASIRSVRDTLEAVLDRPGVRFLGNVPVGGSGGVITAQELRDCYDAVIWTYGASRDRRLGIPGEDLAGSVAATDLVAWYTGHPDADEHFSSFLPSRQRAVIVGVGNVAVDVARILAKTPAELAPTDMPPHVLETLADTDVRQIHVLGRRGPAWASWTTKELRELGELADADVVVDPADLVLDPASESAIAGDRLIARNVEVLRAWSHREPRGARRTLSLHFGVRPVELVEGPPGSVSGVRIERTAPDGTGSWRGTGETSVIEADLVVRSVGYRGVPIDDLPFDDAHGTIHSDAGRIRPGEYTAGWIRRGPSGIIGTNKKCALGAVDALVADATDGLLPHPAPDRIDRLLAERGVSVVHTEGWRAIDRAERELGAARGVERTTISDHTALLRAAGL